MIKEGQTASLSLRFESCSYTSMIFFSTSLNQSIPDFVFSRVLRDSTPRFVGRSVCRSVGLTLLFLLFL